MPASRAGDDVDPDVVQRIALELERQGEGALAPEDAARLFRERASSELEPADADLVAQVERVVSELLVHVATQQERLARRDVARLEELVARSRDSLERDARAARALQDGCLHFARVMLEQRQLDRAKEQARRCISLFPGIEPDIHQHPPSIFGLIGEVRAELLTETLGTLRVDSEQPGCAVYLNGRSSGSTPAEVARLIPGEYRVQVECPGRPAGSARLHRVVVPAQRRVLFVDTRFDRAVRTTPRLALSYATSTEEDARRLEDGRAVAAILQASPLVLVTPTGAGRYRLDRLDAGAPRVVASVVVRAPLGAGSERLPEAIEALRRRDSVSFEVEPPVGMPPWRGPEPEDAAPAALRLRASRLLAPARARRADGGAGAGERVSVVIGWGFGAAGVLTLGGAWAGWAARTVDVEPLVVAAAAGGVMAMIAVPLVVSEPDGVPWWAWSAGLAGVGLGVWGSLALAEHGVCTQMSLSGDRCEIQNRSADSGALLLAAALPLIEIPILCAAQSIWTPRGAVAFVDVRDDGAVLGAGGVF